MDTLFNTGLRLMGIIMLLIAIVGFPILITTVDGAINGDYEGSFLMAAFHWITLIAGGIIFTFKPGEH